MMYKSIFGRKKKSKYPNPDPKKDPKMTTFKLDNIFSLKMIRIDLNDFMNIRIVI